jgi:type VI secretion system protein ImpF
MAEKDVAETGPDRRLWRKEDRAKVSIMQIFRSRYDENRPLDGDTTITPRIRLADGVTEDQLREHIEADLSALLSTVRLDACYQLKETDEGRTPTRFEAKTPWDKTYPELARSILNYGFCDLSDITQHDLQKQDIVKLIRQSLVDHEPRLLADSIRIKVTTEDGGRAQRLSLFVEADLMGDPVDIPLDFDAEVDLGAGKLRMSKLRVQM